MSTTAQQRIIQLKQWGSHTLAYSSVYQPGLSYFGDQRGFIAFKSRNNKTLVLSDPVCDPEQLQSLLENFIAEYSDISFWQITDRVAKVISSMGFYVNEMGPDFHIPLANYDFKGQSKRNLRAAENRAKRLGYQIKEFKLDTVDINQLTSISEQWRNTRIVKKREVVFLNRPIQLSEEPDLRRFMATDAENKPLAFIFLDPIYQDQNIIGYSTSFKRRMPGSDLRIEQAIMKFIIETLQSEGCSDLYLGCAPLADMVDDYYPYNSIVKWFYNSLFRSALVNQYYYNLQGHYQYKLDYRAEKKNTYYASARYLNMPHYIAFCFVSDIFQWPSWLGKKDQ